MKFWYKILKSKFTDSDNYIGYYCDYTGIVVLKWLIPGDGFLWCCFGVGCQMFLVQSSSYENRLP